MVIMAAALSKTPRAPAIAHCSISTLLLCCGRLNGRSHVMSAFARSSSGISDKNVNSGDNEQSNASQTEVNKFSSFASNWWDSRSNPLVGMNPIRVKFIRDVVQDYQGNGTHNEESHQSTCYQLPLHNKRILDIGCGGGLLTESLSRLGASHVVGLDASAKVVDVAKVHSFHESSRINLTGDNKNSNAGLQCSALTTIDYVGGETVEEFAIKWRSEPQLNGPNELFDVITALEVVEHVPNPSSLLQAATSLLKPNGILFVSTINRTMKSYGMAIVAAEYITGKVPVGTHNWQQFFSPKEIETMIHACSSSMKQVSLSGMVLRPPFINMQWSLNPSDTDINWIGAYQKE